MLSPQLLKELQTIIRDEYGRELSVEEVEMISKNLIGYFDLLAEINHRSSTNTGQEVISKSSENKLAANTFADR